MWWMGCVVDGWEGFWIMKKLQWIKKHLKEWNLNTFGRLVAKKNDIWAEIQTIKNMGDGEGGIL